jgi:signal transduction histidine kinase
MIWVEVLSRHHDVLSRHRCDDDASIGRAYDNDVVLDDPYVAPHHVRLAREADGALYAEDLGTVNGISTGPRARRQSRVPLDGREVLHVGRTLLRVRDDGHGFAEAPSHRINGRLRGRPGGLGLSGMRERALLVGGSLDVFTAPGAGTTIELTMGVT